MRDNLTQQRLRKLLCYDPVTGSFLRLVATRGVSTKRPAGGRDSNGYRRIMLEGHSYQLHTLAWLYTHGKFPKYEIDHINGDRADNRIENLRDVPHAMNAQNRRRAQKNNSAARLLGVTAKGEKWQAQITIRGRSNYIGLFRSPAEAHAAYLFVKRRQHPGCTL